MKDEFDALAGQPICQAAKASDYIQYLTKAFIVSSMLSTVFKYGFRRSTSTISCKGLVFRLSTDLNSLSCHGDDDLLGHNC